MHRFKVLTGLVATLVLALPGYAGEFETERAAFREAYPKVRAGDAKALRRAAGVLASYPLLPDLQAAYYIGRLGKANDAEIAAFIEDHPDIAIVRTLRHRFAVSLSKRGKWDDYLSIYHKYYASAGNTKLDCRALTARLADRRMRGLSKDALSLWMVGTSRPQECDRVFEYLDDQGELTIAQYRKRIRLALDRKKFSLAEYLARQATDEDVEWVERWRRMRRAPDKELRDLRDFRDTEAERSLLSYGIGRLARPDPQAAWRVRSSALTQFDFSSDERAVLTREVALVGAYKGERDAHDWLDELASPDDETLEWQVRVALRRGDWPRAIQTMVGMAPALANESRWRYWQARAHEALGEVDAARLMYESLAASRGYHSFLAADRLEQPYAFLHAAVVADEVVLAALASDPRVIRARELYKVDRYGFARSEWDRAVETLDDYQRAQAALLASRWNWPSRAIRSLPSGGASDDLILRFPTPYKEHFDETTRRAEIPRTWAYGIARSESHFMPDVRSSAGALGLMQLMPGTGKEVARRAQLRYRGTPTLLNPDTNIKLGVHYLGQMYHRHDRNPVLATAAYNAGPHRVKRWLPDGEALPSDIWIETIPYDETRKYVQRVLYSETIFHWRLTGRERRLAGVMPPVAPKKGRGGALARK